ncbi:MAG TPA: SPFH domain-containing protein, partial [Candidatus Luteimonas excrementigallinarum]|nr:SPFH domain-containing protein [Candidatus Luteimonas excrementigallinarum]
MKENPIRSFPGIPVLLVLLAVMLACAGALYLGVVSISEEGALFGVATTIALMVGPIVVAALSLLGLIGLYMVEPNQSAVLSLFGRYVGTVKENGLRWNNPFFTKRKVSLRIRNF